MIALSLYDVQTANGFAFNLKDVDPDKVNLANIARGLGNICRYTGQLKHAGVHYSVAEHSVLGADLVPHELRLHFLLHDAAEAYFGDVSTPLKRLLPNYKSLETACSAVIYEKYLGRQMTEEEAHIVSIADLQIFLAEVKVLCVHSDPSIFVMPSPTLGEKDILDTEPPTSVKLHCWSNGVAELMYRSALAKAMQEYRSTQQEETKLNVTT